MKAVLAGGSGLIGTALSQSLVDDGCEVVVLSRSPGGPSGTRVVRWDGKSQGDWAAELDGADAVVNLSGYPVFSRWHARTRDLILSSRVDTTRAIRVAIAGAGNPPRVWVNLSAVGFYGDTGETRVDESSPPGTGFMADTCQAWENAALEPPRPSGGEAAQEPPRPSGGEAAKEPPRPSGGEGAGGEGLPTRLVLARMGVVLSRHGGALEPLVPLTKAFLGGHLGHGRQGMSWVHEDDAVGLLRHALEHPIEGPLNVTAPHPVSHREFMATLRELLHRPWAPPVPAFALKLAVLLGAPPPDVLLEGQYVLPTAGLESGYRFQFGELKAALSAVLSAS